MLYHNIEKGLSLPSPRSGFGVEAIANLVHNLDRYTALWGSDETARAAAAALNSYLAFNRSAGLADSDIPSFQQIENIVARVRVGQRDLQGGGVKRVSKAEVDQFTRPVSLEFFESRSSVRNFADGPVLFEDIEFAARAALKSPAVCNRQFGRVYHTREPETIRDALELQGGARGFLDRVPAVAVITTSLRSYWNPGERMQAWTDGGMFAMSFVLGLHARGLGSVCLNWSKTPRQERRFRQAFDIPVDEAIIMLVAFGPLHEEYSVAVSPRTGLADLIVPLRRL